MDNECVAAKAYLSQDKKQFDVNLLGSLKRHRKHLHLLDNILYWKNKVVVPKGLRSDILRMCHDHPMSGHFAMDRTSQRFQDHYFWPGALNDVEGFVNSCQKCNEFNPPRSSYVKAPLQPIHTRKRFELVCYDLAGPFLPVTVRGNKYALIIVDHFTHWPEFVALPNITAPTIATALVDQWCCRYGVPDRFHSDGASNVHGQVLKELCKHLGVQKSKSSRLHPQGDGMAESFVKQLKSCIQKQVEANGSDWDLYLHTTAFAIRSNVAYNTKHSPSELVLGEKLVQPVDHIIDNTSKTFNQKQGTDFAKDIKTKIKKSNQVVNQNLFVSRKKMKDQFDKGVKLAPFDVGDLVMLWKPYKKARTSGCFQPNWHGPWTIVKFTGNSKTNCKITNCNDSSHKMNVHVNQLKLVKSSRTIPIDSEIIHDTQGSQNTQEPVRPFLDYLEDFEEDDGIVHVEPQRIDENVEPPAQNEQPVQIDQRWVTVDASNILPNRTRGHRPNYAEMEAGD